MVASEPSETDGSICIGCGFCCDGTLHDHANVTSDDEAATLAAGLLLVRNEKKVFFRQPCPKFGGGRCSIYDERPEVCRGYRCKLRKDVDEGRTTAPDAREKIEVVKGLLTAIRQFDAQVATPDERRVLWRQLREELDGFEGEQRTRRAKAILDIAALDFYLERWFRKNAIKDEAVDS